jgi:hypothetical protein
MDKRYILFLMIFLLAVSCKREISGSQGEHILLVDYSNKAKIKLSEFVSDVSIIRLETTSNSIIGEISKIQFFNDRIYLLDMRSNAVYIFDISGKFIYELNKIGQGPEEYIALTDLQVNKNGIYVLDISTHRIIRYGFDFKFLEAIKFNTLGSGFVPDNTGFWLYNETNMLPDDFQLTRIDNKGSVIAEYFQRNTRPHLSYSYASSNVFQRNNNKLYFSPRWGNEIHEEGYGEWNPAFQFSFKDKTYTGEMNISDEDIENDDYVFRRNYFILDDYLIIDYKVRDMRLFSFYNKRTHKIVSGSIENDMISASYNRFFPQFSEGNFLIESIDAHYVFEYFPDLKEIDVLKSLQPDDNPILILYTLKIHR